MRELFPGPAGWVCVLLVSILGAPVAGAAPSASEASGLAGPFTVQVGAAAVRVRLAGDSGPSVVLISGLAGGLEGWEAVQDALAKRARVLAWDRPGIGESPPAAGPRRPAEIAAELEELLRAVALPQPYVLVGHSFGAIHARAFAALHPDQVTGLVLVDPTHDDFRSFTPEDRWKRFVALAGARYQGAGPGPEGEWEGYLAEVKEGFPSVPRELPAVPTVVLKALPPPQAGAANLDPYARWIAGRSDALLVATPTGGHDLPTTSPDLVLWSIGRVLDAAGAASAACGEVPGLAPLLAPGTAILAGEMHGTREAPAFVRSVACAALTAGVPVTVALEIDRAEDAAFQEFLRSDGSEAARARLLASPFWHRKVQDGRSSEAMLGLVDGLRQLSAGAAPGAFHLLLLDRPQPGDQRDQAMADRLAEAIDARPGDLFVSLTGNIHNRLQKGMSWNQELEPMAYRLHRMRPGARIVSLDMAYPGGTAWVCFGDTPEDCKAQELRGPESAEGRSGIELSQDPEGAPYSGRYFTGPVSASPPAVGEAGSDG